MNSSSGASNEAGSPGQNHGAYKYGKGDLMVGDSLSIASPGIEKMGTSHVLRTKLQELLAMRAEIDEDISSLQRTIQVMEGGSS
jgi:hypothetical protein